MSGESQNKATLSSLAIGQSATIEDVVGDDSLVQRLMEFGLTTGEKITVVRFAPLGDPIEIRVRGYNLSLRRMEAQAILIGMIE